MLWEQLEQFVDELQEIASGLEHGHDVDMEALAEMRGRAHAAAVCVALVTNPYDPDVAQVKSDAMDRWEMRQGVSDFQEKLIQRTVRKANERTTSMTDEERRSRREARQARRAARNG